MLFIGVQAAQHQRQYQHIKERINEIIAAVDRVDQVMLSEGPQQRADHPQARAPQPRAFDEKEHGRREQRQRDGHAKRAGQVPVIGENQQSQAVEPLQVDDFQLGGVEPVMADDGSLFVEQVGEDHFRGKVGIDDPFAGHQLIPQVKQVRCRHPQPRQRLPDLVQRPALCLLFHAVSPKSDMFS